MKYSNIFYINSLNAIGGCESYIYYLARKYKDIDITVFYRTANQKQLDRLEKIVRCVRYKGQKIKCKKAFFTTYNMDCIDNIDADEYIGVIHTDYSLKDEKPVTYPKITKYIAVSKSACEAFTKVTGISCELCYNPIMLDKPKRVLNLISATRLTKEKGKDRMKKFAKLLEKNNIPYIWIIFTNDNKKIRNPNIIYKKPSLEVIDYIANADYLVQLSNKEGYGYTPIEALMVGTPVIVTDCPVFKEIGIKNGENGFIVDFNLNNINYTDIYKKRLKFDYEPPEDIYNKLLAKEKNTYLKDLKNKIKVICIKNYFDEELQENKKIIDKPYYIDKKRAKKLFKENIIKYY